MFSKINWQCICGRVENGFFTPIGWWQASKFTAIGTQKTIIACCPTCLIRIIEKETEDATP